MRVSKEQLEFLKRQVKNYLPKAKVYLFGSRADSQKKGGDIDILILSDRVLTLREKRQIRIAFFTQFGEQKLDLVSFTFEREDPFKEWIMLEAIEL